MEDSRRPILLIGVNGQLGWELLRTLAPLGEVHAPARSELDLGDQDAIRRCVREWAPKLIVNAAAYTAVDHAEDDIDTAMAINATAPGILAEEANRLDAALIHYSTDYVFGGVEIREPYREEDALAPLNVYGQSKLLGEQAIQASNTIHLIFRLSWVYSQRGNNFLLTMQKLARERTELSVIDDQIGSPTWARMVAEATGQILSGWWRGDAGRLAECGGLYHIAAPDWTTWHGFALEIIAMTNETVVNQVRKISTKEYPTRAQRPQYSVLDSGKLQKVFNLSLPTWKRQLELSFSN